MDEISVVPHRIVRMRRDTRRRLVRVAAIEQVTPKMRRIRFASPELHDFESLAPDDHVKLFFPNAVGADGDGKPSMRDYTPRAFDTVQGTLTIDFALHEGGVSPEAGVAPEVGVPPEGGVSHEVGAVHDVGPATAWALAAQVGDEIQIGGPRGSVIVADDFDWYLLIGDETALPAIGRRVETLRAGVPVKTIAVVSDAAERQAFTTRAAWEAVWVWRDGTQADDAGLLLAALRDFGPLPAGDGYIWIAAEAQVARSLRSYVLETLGHNKAWVKASGYWMIGQADAHVNIES